MKSIFVCFFLCYGLFCYAKYDCKVEDSENPFVCNICFSAFPSQKRLWRHNLTHREKTFKCPFCDKQFVMLCLVNVHVRRVHQKTKKFVCEFCDYATFRKDKLRGHIAVNHTRKFPFNCNLCNKGFCSNYNLRMHEEVAHDGMRLVCQFCSKTFKSSYYFQIHLKRHDPNNDDKVDCPQCSKSVYKYGLKRHMSIHNEEKQSYVCDICGKNIVSLKNLNLHKKVHVGEKDHTCGECFKTFGRKYLLDTHMRVHNQEKPYKCNECDKAYSQNCSLVIHKRYHTGERPYKCEFCPKKFVSNNLLRSHKCKMLK